mgnify:FL=1
MIAIAIKICVMLTAVMENLSNRLAKKIRTLRGDQTQREFARKLGISQTTLNHIEQGKENVTLKTVQKICDRLKCDVGWLFEKP